MPVWLASLVALMQLIAALFAPAPQPARAVQPARPIAAEASAQPTKAPVLVTHDGRATARATGIRVDASRTGASIDVAVTGGELAGVWRITIAGTGSLAAHRVVVVVETSDVAFTGSVEAYDGSRRTAAFALDSSFKYCDRSLGLCLAASGLTMPNGDAKLAVRATTTASVPYAVTGALREAHDAAFQWGPWISARPLSI